MNLKHLNHEQKKLRKRVLEISYRRKLSHLGSCLSALDTIMAVYQVKNEQDRFVLSCGHAGVAWYAVLEKYRGLDPKTSMRLGIHPDRNKKYGIDVSTGSLGQGLPIAVGMALADRRNKVYCLISDGECAEGSIWEALAMAVKAKLGNLKILVNVNGWGAYDKIETKLLGKRLQGFCPIQSVDGHNLNLLHKALKAKTGSRPLLLIARTNVGQFPFLKGIDAHYYLMTEKDYQKAIRQLV